MNAALKRAGRHLIDLRGRALGRYPWLKHIGRAEVVLLGGALISASSAYQFVELADDVREGETTPFDRWALESFRRGDDPALPIGPQWVRDFALDFTSLGSHAIVIFVVVSVGMFLALRRQWRVMALVLAVSMGSIALSTAFKRFVNRDRPDVVPRWHHVTTPSFPSALATVSAAVYLTLGAILAKVVRGRWSRAYCLALAALVVFLIGLSRVYIGVHYPTDVLGGWAMGFAWALTCWAVAHFLRRRGLPRLRRIRPGSKIRGPSLNVATGDQLK